MSPPLHTGLVPDQAEREDKNVQKRYNSVFPLQKQSVAGTCKVTSKTREVLFIKL